MVGFQFQLNGKKYNFDPIAFGGDGGGVPHVPIPNTTVKPSSADGTWTAGSWESRTPPSKEPLPMMFGGGFYLCLYLFLRSSSDIFVIVR